MVITQIAEPVQHHARREPRKSMFVMATIYAAAGSAPVKVRDMSSRGALIEGAVIPAAGTEVRLCRGSLSIASEVVWSREGRGGLVFDSNVSVADWLPSKRALAAQQRVDVIVQQTKVSRIVDAAPAAVSPTFPPSEFTALELTRLRQAIESLANDLADDPAAVERHGPKLETLDLAAQTLRKLAAER